MIAKTLALALLAADPVPAGPVPLLEALALGGAPGATQGGQPLLREAETKVEPGASFRVAAAVPLADARLVLHDALEALVPAGERAEIGASASRFTVTPSRPLAAGARLTLRLEGAAGRELHDLAGQAYLPVAFALRVAGEPPAPPPPRKRPRRRPAAP